MSVLLALASALAYGTSDFLGGLTGRRAPVWSVAVVVQLASAVSTAAIALPFGGSPTVADLAWALLAGIGSGVGVGFLFRGLAGSRMSVVAPLSAVGSAVVPVVIALLTGERPSVLAAVGIVTALPGIWLVARAEEATDHDGDPSLPRRSGVLDGALAGLGFGIMFTAIGQVPDGAGFWPLALTQAVSTVAAALLATLLGAAWRPVAASWRAVPAGPLAAAAVITFQLATQGGLLAVSSVLASLYPAATIMLAVVVLGERVRAAQTAGLLLCGGAVTLVALG